MSNLSNNLLHPLEQIQQGIAALILAYEQEAGHVLPDVERDFMASDMTADITGRISKYITGSVEHNRPATDIDHDKEALNEIWDLQNYPMMKRFQLHLATNNMLKQYRFDYRNLHP